MGPVPFCLEPTNSEIPRPCSRNITMCPDFDREGVGARKTRDPRQPSVMGKCNTRAGARHNRLLSLTSFVTVRTCVREEPNPSCTSPQPPTASPLHAAPARRHSPLCLTRSDSLVLHVSPQPTLSYKHHCNPVSRMCPRTPSRPCAPAKTPTHTLTCSFSQTPKAPPQPLHTHTLSLTHLQTHTGLPL